MKALLVLSFALALSTGGCGQPISSGTNTNWLKTCVRQDECDVATSCTCGLCTATCSSDEDCPSGICGSGLGSANQCGGTDHGRLCLPKPTQNSSCTEVPVPSTVTLAASIEPTCTDPGALICENFDAPLPRNYGTWTDEIVHPSIQDCRVHRGAGALRYQSAGSGMSQTRMRLPTPISSGPLYARFYTYVPSGQQISDYLGLFELWCADDSADGKISVELVADDAVQIFVTPQDGGVYRSPTWTLKRDRWTCIQIALDVSSNQGTARVSVDGQVVIERTGITTLPPSPISVAVIEGLAAPDSTGFDLTFDDLVVSTRPVGCL